MKLHHIEPFTDHLFQTSSPFPVLSILEYILDLANITNLVLKLAMQLGPEIATKNIRLSPPPVPKIFTFFLSANQILSVERARNVITRNLANKELAEYLCFVNCILLPISLLNILLQWNVPRASTWRGRMVMCASLFNSLHSVLPMVNRHGWSF